MKDYKRAYRRHKKYVKFIRRAKNWFKSSQDEEYNLQQALEGKCCTWLRTTGRPCNCYMCSNYEKYKRPLKNIVKKDILNQMTDVDSKWRLAWRLEKRHPRN